MYGDGDMCVGSPYLLEDLTCSDFAVRPVVTLKSNIIDISNVTDDNGKDSAHAWQLK